MIKDITLGQFFPGNSLLHRLDPRIKIILTILFIAIVFLAKSTLSYLLVLAFTIALIIISGISFKTVLKSLKPIVFVLIITSALNIFWTVGDDLIFSFWIIDIYAEGVNFAILMVLRITSLLIGTSVLLTYTTSPIMLTDGLERLLAPLKAIKVPVHEFSLMMTIALRFIPTLIEETDKIMSAQKARGADFTTGSIISRAKALIPVLIPLFISSFRRADELATAMECRCYHGGDGRTKMNTPHLKVIDILTVSVFIVICVIIVMLNRFA
ncbi:MAG: energy-coupling factor transporter transmembrane protein EcfT [Clostridia bacterium]|nr:energy-coupling factor transporter transmembrane protein EcfT [Clostridia bacterium]